MGKYKEFLEFAAKDEKVMAKLKAVNEKYAGVKLEGKAKDDAFVNYVIPIGIESGYVCTIEAIKGDMPNFYSDNFDVFAV